eukprot:gene8023-1253_t
MELVDGVTMGHLNEAKSNPIGLSISSFFAKGAPDANIPGQAAEVFIIVNATCVELPNVQQYIESHSGQC